MKGSSLHGLYPIRFISEWSFFALGMGYCIAFFLKSNSMYITACEYYFRLADNPFLLSALIYFFISMRIKSEEVFIKNRMNDSETKNFFLQDAVFIFLGAIIFLPYFIFDLVPLEVFLQNL